MKASEGNLYPLKDAFLFVPKPPVHIPFKSVVSMEFNRLGKTLAASRTFDFKVETSTQSYTFSSIPREDFDNFYGYLKSKDKVLPVPQLDIVSAFSPMFLLHPL